MFNFIADRIIGSIASVHSLLFAPIGEYVVTITTGDPDEETWTDTRRTMTKEQLERFVARVRPDLVCEAITLEPGEVTTLGTDQYESVIFIERI